MTVEDLRQAEDQIIRSVQQKAFGEEIATLKSKKAGTNATRESRKKEKSTMKKSSVLHQLDPFLDDKGILRVGGRMRQSDEVNSVKHPCIRPKTSHVTNLLVRHNHESVEHQGRGMTLNSIRSSGFWIIGGRALVRSQINQCVRCQKLRGSCQDQKMCDLPRDRLTAATSIYVQRS